MAGGRLPAVIAPSASAAVTITRSGRMFANPPATASSHRAGDAHLRASLSFGRICESPRLAVRNVQNLDSGHALCNKRYPIIMRAGVPGRRIPGTEDDAA